MPIGSDRQSSIKVVNTTTAVTRGELVWWELGVSQRIVGVAWQTAAVTEDFNLCYRCEKIRLPIFGATGANFVEGSWVYYDATVDGRLVDDADGGANPRCAIVLEPVADGATEALVQLIGDLDAPLREAATDRAAVRTEFGLADDLIMDATPRPILNTVYETSATYTIGDLNTAGPPIGIEHVPCLAGDTLQVVGFRVVVDGAIVDGVGNLDIADQSNTVVVAAMANAALIDTNIIGSHGVAIANVAVSNLHTDLTAGEGIWLRREADDFTHGTGVTASVLWKVVARA